MHLNKSGLLCLTLLCTTPAIAADPETAPQQSETATPETAGALVTVNGKEVSQALYAHYFRARREARPGQGESREQQLAALNELINYILLEQDAVARGLDKAPSIIAQLDLARIRLLANAAIQDYIGRQKIEEQELKQIYDARFSDKAVKEYRVRLLQLDSESAAKEAIAALDNGAGFADLARQRSTDPSGKNGGDLGWMSQGQMPPALEQALQPLQPGGYTPEPVKTEFGWQVLQLEAVRDLPHPSYAELRPQLLREKQQQLLSEYIQKLRSEAKLELKSPR